MQFGRIVGRLAGGQGEINRAELDEAQDRGAAVADQRDRPGGVGDLRRQALRRVPVGQKGGEGGRVEDVPGGVAERGSGQGRQRRGHGGGRGLGGDRSGRAAGR